MYRFREIICHKCGHKFVHMKHSAYSSSSHYEYLKKDTGELLDYAVCPKCSSEMVLFDHTHIGVDPDSTGIVRGIVRGI